MSDPMDLSLSHEHATDEELLLQALDLACFYAREVLRESEHGPAREIAARTLLVFAPRKKSCSHVDVTARMQELRRLAKDETVTVVWSSDDRIYRIDADRDNVYGAGTTPLEAIESAIEWVSGQAQKYER